MLHGQVIYMFINNHLAIYSKAYFVNSIGFNLFVLF